MPTSAEQVKKERQKMLYPIKNGRCPLFSTFASIDAIAPKRQNSPSADRNSASSNISVLFIASPF